MQRCCIEKSFEMQMTGECLDKKVMPHTDQKLTRFCKILQDSERFAKFCKIMQDSAKHYSNFQAVPRAAAIYAS